jgi:predicted RNA-binding protein with PUA domain
MKFCNNCNVPLKNGDCDFCYSNSNSLEEFEQEQD